MASWQLDSWQQFAAQQQPEWPDQHRLKRVLKELNTFPPLVFAGEVEGFISEDVRGNGGFGYDPILEVEGKTFGEMPDFEKNSLSHRYRALVNFAGWLKEVE